MILMELSARSFRFLNLIFEGDSLPLPRTTAQKGFRGSVRTRNVQIPIVFYHFLEVSLCGMFLAAYRAGRDTILRLVSRTRGTRHGNYESRF